MSLGFYGGSPYVNAIGSFSFADDRAVVHANLGAVDDRKADRLRGTWGIGLEALLWAPRLYGILETYGLRDEKPTLHAGLRFWVRPQRVQLDATVGAQYGQPDRRFVTVGSRSCSERPRARHTRSGVSGMSISFTPSASITRVDDRGRRAVAARFARAFRAERIHAAWAPTRRTLSPGPGCPSARGMA